MVRKWSNDPWFLFLGDFEFRKQYRFGKDPQIVINFHVETVTKILTIKVNGITKFQNSQGNLSY